MMAAARSSASDAGVAGGAGLGAANHRIAKLQRPFPRAPHRGFRRRSPRSRARAAGPARARRGPSAARGRSRCHRWWRCARSVVGGMPSTSRSSTAFRKLSMWLMLPPCRGVSAVRQGGGVAWPIDAEHRVHRLLRRVARGRVADAEHRDQARQAVLASDRRRGFPSRGWTWEPLPDTIGSRPR